MAKIKYEINEDSTLIKFLAVEDGEIFIRDEMPFYKTGGDCYYNAINLAECEWLHFYDNTLVTYVKKAELKLTI